MLLLETADIVNLGRKNQAETLAPNRKLAAQRAGAGGAVCVPDLSLG